MTDIGNAFNRGNAKVLTQKRVILNAGDNSVVGNDRLPKMPKGSMVVITDDVYQTMKMIGDISNEIKQEVPFLLFGHSEGQTVIFDDIEADKSGSADNQEAVFSQELAGKLTRFCRNAKKSENKIIAHGHSHPRIGNSYLNYSIADINAYIDLRDKNDIVKNNVDVCGCLLTGGNYNFVFYDGRDTYRFDNVYVQMKNGEFGRLSAFGPDEKDLLNKYTRSGRV